MKEMNLSCKMNWINSKLCNLETLKISQQTFATAIAVDLGSRRRKGTAASDGLAENRCRNYGDSDLHAQRWTSDLRRIDVVSTVDYDGIGYLTVDGVGSTSVILQRFTEEETTLDFHHGKLHRISDGEWCWDDGDLPTSFYQLNSDAGYPSFHHKTL